VVSFIPAPFKPQEKETPVPTEKYTALLKNYW